MVAGSTKRLASRFYQVKTGRCLTGQYLHWMKNRHTSQCWWCRYQTQTRKHLFKECPEWKAQQKILWAEMWKEAGRWKSQWKIRGLLADGRCSQAVLDFLSATDVGRRVPAEEDAESETSERELRERQELGEERRAEELGAAGELGAGEELPLFLYTPSFMASADDRWERAAASFFCFSLLSPTLVRIPFLRGAQDRPGRKAKGSLQRAATMRTADGKNG